MSINLTVPDDNNQPMKPKLTVIGVGGAGGNAVNNMIRAELEGVEFIVANTDAQALSQSNTQRRVQLGKLLTEGLGAGSRPDVGRAAAEESIDEILAELDGSHMLFIAAGMGGGTGTGAAPVIARAAKEQDILTVGVVTKPFQFEGSHRMKQAEAGIEDLEQYVDTLIVIPNQNLFRIANEKTTFADAFAKADEVLYSGVRGVTDLMVMPGLINLDFADIRTVMGEMGKAMMGTGEAEGERRALDAAEAAIANPLLDDTSMKGAKGVLINITGGTDITLFEVDEAANRIRAEVDEDAYIIVGSAFDKDLEGTMRVSVVATGIDADASQMALPTMLHLADQLDKSQPAPDAAATFAAVAEDETETDPIIETKAGDDASMEPEADTETESEAEIPTTAGESLIETDDDIAEDQAVPSMHTEPAVEDEPEIPPVAMPQVGATDVFIPPEPVEFTMLVKAEIPDAVTENQDAGKADAAETPIRPKKVSLFERVTGGRRAAFGRKALEPQKKPEEAENKDLTAPDETPPLVSEADKADFFSEAPKVAVPGPVTADAETEHPLGGMDSEDKLPLSDSADDLLDIPAFLRRQAN